MCVCREKGAQEVHIPMVQCICHAGSCVGMHVYACVHMRAYVCVRACTCDGVCGICSTVLITCCLTVVRMSTYCVRWPLGSSTSLNINQCLVIFSPVIKVILMAESFVFDGSEIEES